MQMIVTIWSRSGFSDHTMNLVAYVDEDRREELIRGSLRQLVSLPQRPPIIRRIAGELDGVTNLHADRFDVSTFPPCYALKHTLQRRVGRRFVGHKARAAIRPGKDGSRPGDLERYAVDFHI